MEEYRGLCHNTSSFSKSSEEGKYLGLPFILVRSNNAALGYIKERVSPLGSSAAGGCGRATPIARGRGHATSTARGRGPTTSTGRGRGSVSPTALDDIQDREPSTEPVVTTTDADPITQVITNSVAPTVTIDPAAAYQAIQTLVGMFTGQQAQAGPADASRSMTLDKGTVLDRFLKTTPPSYMGFDKPSDAEAWLLRMENILTFWAVLRHRKCHWQRKVAEKEEDKVWHFLRGLRPDIRGRVSLLDSETLSQLVTKVLTAEKDIVEEKGTENQYKRYRPGQSSGSGHLSKRVQTSIQTNEGMREASRPCFKCGKPHATVFRCDGSPQICFTCGQAGHISTYCRTQVGGRNQAPQGHLQPVHGGGHNQRQSNNQGNYKQHARNGGQGQKNVTEGRVYALTQQ
ncbi:hypothetical protein Vadar_003318 [Vaccinium darrowii]|uniref:Uncharacterized protein n=1 Tax=Vaccinium darrowii TaxID=229202 RepID=A0ACB7ZHV7_9ERIC|nr:hypothetical protein Vadar_003318 [Vaccinium darrowii]